MPQRGGEVMIEMAKCKKCGKELNIPISLNWDIYCTECIKVDQIIKLAKYNAPKISECDTQSKQAGLE